jgi:hypothetical protein
MPAWLKLHAPLVARDSIATMQCRFSRHEKGRL